jgi:flagellin-like protein
MNANTKVIAGIVGSLLLVAVAFPLLVGSTTGTLFTVLLWLLALGIVLTLVFAYTNRRYPR